MAERYDTDVLFKALADPSRRKLLEAANLVATVRSGREKLHFLNLSGDGQILDAGEIVEAESPRRLVIRWQHQNKPELKAEDDSLCTMELEPMAKVMFGNHNVEEMGRKILEAGVVRKLDVPDSHLYFQAPGGQCLRLVGINEDLSKYEGVGEGPNVATLSWNRQRSRQWQGAVLEGACGLNPARATFARCD
jgi:hypothetical protein